MKKKLKAVLFDMDGVLFDSMPYHSEAWHKVMKSHGLTLSREEAYMHEGRTGASTINIVFQRELGREATQEEIESIYQEKSVLFNSYPEAKPMPGAWELLQKVKKDGLIPMVVTGSGQLSLLERLEQPRLHLLRHALPGIFHKEIKVCFLLLHIEFFHFDRDFPTGRREFVSIGNQVQQNLVHTKSIPDQMCMRHLFVLYLKRYPFLLALRFINRADGH